MSIMKTLSNLWEQTAFMNLEWGNYVMILVALVFLYLAIKPTWNSKPRPKTERASSPP